MKIAVLYTAKSDTLVNALATDAKRLLGEDTELLSFQDESALQDIAAAGRVDAQANAKYLHLIADAIAAGADAIVSTCAMYGDQMTALQLYAANIGTPIQALDTEMCRRAVLAQRSLTLLTTSAVSAKAVANDIYRLCDLLGRHPVVKVVVAKGTKGLQGAALAAAFAEQIQAADAVTDCVLLGQPSMVGAREALAALLAKPVYSPLERPLEGIYRALVENGKLR